MNALFVECVCVQDPLTKAHTGAKLNCDTEMYEDADTNATLCTLRTTQSEYYNIYIAS